MPVTTFRERMVGPVGPVARTPWTIRPRGPHGADGLVRLASTTEGGRPGVLDLDGLRVHVTGLDRERDGFAAVLHAGTVRGIGTTPLPVLGGFADILVTAVGGRRMHYRLLVADGRHGFVVDGVKTVRGGLRTAWAATTTLHTVVVRVTPPDLGHDDDVRRWLEAGGVEGEVVLAGVLRVRGLLRQGVSLRGSVPGFLVGFAHRAVRGRPS